MCVCVCVCMYLLILCALIHFIRLSPHQASLPSLDTFRELVKAALGTRGAACGREMSLLMLPGGRIHLSVDGVPAFEMVDAALEWALMDTYVGANAVAPELRTSLAHGFFEKVVR